MVKVNRIGALGYQVGVEKSCMTYFVERVAGDVLRAVAIKVLQSWLIVILCSLCDSAELSILLPQVALDEFGCGQESENCDVSFCEVATRARLLSKGSQAMTQKSSADRCGAGSDGSVFYE